MSWNPDPGYIAAKDKEETRKDDELFVRLASEIIPPTLKPEMKDAELTARLEALWKWWNE